MPDLIKRIAACLLLSSACNACAADRGPSFTLSATAERVDGRPMLRMSLSYEGSEPVSIYKSSLPWGSRQSMVLVLADSRPAGEILPKDLLIDDPDHDRVKITKGAKLEGEIDLQQWFPSLSKHLSVNDVIAFWSYTPQPVGKRAESALMGQVVIPQTSSSPAK